MKKLVEIEKMYTKTGHPEMSPGDTVKVHYRVVEGGKERIQIFQGTVIKIRGGGLSKTFMVRKISFGVGVDRTFPLNSPKISKIEVIRQGKVRRAKLYYLKDRVGKATKVKEKKYVPLKKNAAPEAPEETGEEN